MPKPSPFVDLEDIVTAVYTALDDAMVQAGARAKDGKLVPRRGPRPEVDDREVLCLAVLQEILGFESDHGFHQWLNKHPVMLSLFPRRLSRQNWADRRALLTPLLRKLTSVFCMIDEEEEPPFSSSTPIRSMSAGRSGRERRNGSPALPGPATAHP
jgi:hypothetical protein